MRAGGSDIIRVLRRFGLVDLGFDGLGEGRAHPGGGGLVEPVDGDHAVDHVGGHLGKGSALEPHRDHRATGITTDRPERPGYPGWTPEGRDDEPGRPLPDFVFRPRLRVRASTAPPKETG